MVKEGGGGDNLAVGWQLPNGTFERPIPGNRIIPFAGGGGGCNPPSAPNISANPSSINSGGSATLTASNCGGTVNWSNGASGNSVSVNPNTTTNYTATCSQSGCTSGNSNTATVTVNSGGGGGGNACSPENIQCSGNQYETRDYVVNASSSGNYTIQVLYRSHEGQGQIRWQVNGGAVQTMSVAQTGVNDYPQITLGSASLNAGNNTITLSSGSLFLCFKQVCIVGGGGCNPPNPPNISANPSTINSGGSSTLTASNCGGTVNWSNGASGNSISVSPSATTNYTATCSQSGCTSGNSNTATVTVNSGGGGNACSPENIQYSGNQYETRDYVVNASNSGNYTVKVFCRSHEGQGQIRWQVNGGAVQTMSVAQTGLNDYPQITLGSASLNAGNNTITLSSGSLFLCFKQVCIQSGARIGLDETIQPNNNDLIISPNPTDGILNLKLWLSEASVVNVEVQDLTGRGVKAQNFGQQTGQFNETINLSDLPAGMYLLQLRTDKRTFAKKLMVVR